MKLWLNIALQTAAIVANYLAVNSSILPAKYAPFIAGAQAILGYVAHMSEPPKKANDELKSSAASSGS